MKTLALSKAQLELVTGGNQGGAGSGDGVVPPGISTTGAGSGGGVVPPRMSTRGAGSGDGVVPPKAKQAP